MNDQSDKPDALNVDVKRSLVGAASRALVLGAINFLSTPLAIQAWIYDEPWQGFPIAIASISNIASVANTMAEIYRSTHPKQGDYLDVNVSRALLSLIPFIGSAVGANIIMNTSDTPVTPPPTPFITPEWMVPDLDQKAMNAIPRIAEALTGLQGLAGRAIASM
ncbi:hypothetical protein KC675_05060 [Candidatus Dojkabacteria bacterium]|uniref:Uncharacterized protein n=1 Tax=Candidatus Dojkabacteria bacterium TaxID=2099670 RepID=A0A955I829_9BACT|nr:hypothetical protein [Candidatus Dojkabacteria bacterium]